MKPETPEATQTTEEITSDRSSPRRKSLEDFLRTVPSTEIEERDERRFAEITSAVIGPEMEGELVTPPEVYPKEDAVLAVHWHPEFVPIDLVEKRFNAAFPNRSEELIIPTQHNEILSYKGYSGVEVDCYSPEFNLKVQLLLHFKQERTAHMDVLRSMIDHTFHYRSSQVRLFLATLLKPKYEERLQRAAKESGATADLVAFVRHGAAKLKALLERNELTMRKDMVKNKLLRDYFNQLRDEYEDGLIDKAQVFLKEVKKIVKAGFSPSYFYETREIIEEARSHQAGILVPHPEQFWPILLADYDVDGFEVWNPQSRHYTEFLIGAVARLNAQRRRPQRALLITMGDDCHMGEKTKPARWRDPAKAGREVGVQPAWRDVAIEKNLVRYNVGKRRVIEEYRARLI